MQSNGNNCLRELSSSHALIDTHAHLDSRSFQRSMLPKLMSRTMAKGLQEVWLMSVSAQSFLENIEIISSEQPNYPRLKLRLAMGLDPELLIPGSATFDENLYSDAATMAQDQFSELVTGKLKKLAAEAIRKGIRVEVVGEIGIDHYRLDKSNIECMRFQESMFRSQLRYAAEFGLPVSIHSRGAESLVIDIISEFKQSYPELIGIFHSFTGTYKQMQLIRALGFYIGVNGIVTYKSGKDILDSVRKIAEISTQDSNNGATIPERLAKLYKCGIVLETDAPYLIPSNTDSLELKSIYTKKVNEPAQVIMTLNHLYKL